MNLTITLTPLGFQLVDENGQLYFEQYHDENRQSFARQDDAPDDTAARIQAAATTALAAIQAQQNPTPAA